MITSDEIKNMSDEEFDIFQKKELEEIKKQLKDKDINFDIPDKPTFKCSNCNTVFTSETYNILVCPKCGYITYFKKNLITTLELIEKTTCNKN